MRNIVIITGAVLLSCLLVVGVYFYVHKNEKVNTYTEKKLIKAPNFNLPDAEGNVISFENIKSDVKIINFWASWSPYGAKELTVFSKIKDEYGNKVDIIALDRDNNTQDGKRFLKSLNLNEDIIFVYDKNDEYFKKTNGFAVPETVFLNKDEEIVFHKHGPITYEEVRKNIEEMLK